MAGSRSFGVNGLTTYARAPASLARSTSSFWLNAVSSTTGAMWFLVRRSAAEMPSSWGILTSITTRSGRSSVASATAVSPSPASPTTSNPLSRRISTMSRRISDSSSATTTRRGAVAEAACSCSVTIESYGMVNRVPAGVAEWQTRPTQTRLPERACGFDSHHRHVETGAPGGDARFDVPAWAREKPNGGRGPRGRRLRALRSGAWRGRGADSHHRHVETTKGPDAAAAASDPLASRRYAPKYWLPSALLLRASNSPCEIVPASRSALARAMSSEGLDEAC